MKNEANTLCQKTKYDKLKYYLKSDNRKQISFNDFNRIHTKLFAIVEKVDV